MHELNICLNILELLSAQAECESFYRIKTLWLEIGALAGIEVDVLRFSFPIAARHSIAEDAELEIISLEGRAWCDVCQSNFALKTLFDPCLQCGNYNYQITQGKECRVVKTEVE